MKCLLLEYFLFVMSDCCDLFNGRSRSSQPEVFLGKGVLKICSKFTGEHLCQSAISIKLLRRTPFPRNTSGWLLLILFAGYTCPKIDET